MGKTMEKLLGYHKLSPAEHLILDQLNSLVGYGSTVLTDFDSRHMQLSNGGVQTCPKDHMMGHNLILADVYS